MTNLFAGEWSYRSFLNEAKLTDCGPEKPKALLFAEGTWAVKDGPATVFGAVLSFSSDFIMNWMGVVSPRAHCWEWARRHPLGGLFL